MIYNYGWFVRQTFDSYLHCVARAEQWKPHALHQIQTNRSFFVKEDLCSWFYRTSISLLLTEHWTDMSSSVSYRLHVLNKMYMDVTWPTTEGGWRQSFLRIIEMRLKVPYEASWYVVSVIQIQKCAFWWRGSLIFGPLRLSASTQVQDSLTTIFLHEWTLDDLSLQFLMKVFHMKKVNCTAHSRVEQPGVSLATEMRMNSFIACPSFMGRH